MSMTPELVAVLPAHKVDEARLLKDALARKDVRDRHLIPLLLVGL